MLHPVVPLNESLDFTESLSTEIQSALTDVKKRQQLCHDEIIEGITDHKKHLRSHILKVRAELQVDFEAFFNDLLNSIRKDWNLFTVQETLVKEVKSFGDKVLEQLAKITGKDSGA